MAKGNQKDTVPARENRKNQAFQGSSKCLVIGRLLLGIAILLASYLAYTSLTSDAVAGCGQEKSCGLVLNSKYSKLLGVPVSLLGAGIYGSLILATLPSLFIKIRSTSFLRFCVLVCITMIPLAALWFGIVQLVLLKAFCPWCTATHIVATIGAVLVYTWMKQALANGGKKGNSTPLLSGALTALVVTSLTAAVQMQSAEEDHSLLGQSKNIMLDDPSTLAPDAPRMITLHNENHKFDVRSYPVNGNPDAEYIMVAIVDHNCPYCSRLKRFLIDMVEYYGEDKLSLMSLPGIGKDQNADQTHLVMLSLWRERPDLYKKISQKILDRTMKADLSSVRRAASLELGGMAKLNEITAKHKEWVTQSLEAAKQLNIENGKVAGKISIPSLIIGEKVFVGAAPIPSKYYLHVEDQFGLVAPPDVKQAFANVGMDDNPYQSKAGVLEVAPEDQKPVHIKTSFKRTEKKVIYPEVNSTGFVLEDYPMIGNPDAKNIAIVMSALATDTGDRLLLDLIKKQKELGDDQLALCFLPPAKPKNSRSLHLTLFATWGVKPELFEPSLMKILTKEYPRDDANLQKAMAPLLKPADIVTVRKVDRNWLNLHLFSGVRTRKGAMLMDDAPAHPSDFMLLYKKGIYYGELPKELK